MIASCRAAVSLTLVAVAVACSAPERPARSHFVALWSERGSAPLGRDDLEALEGAGGRELFADAARVSWESGAPELVALPSPASPRPLAATLAVGGLWKRPGRSSRSIAREWRQSLGELALEAERRRLTPIGFHFDLEIEDGAAELAETLRRLRGELESAPYLSVAIEPETIGSEQARELVGAVDYVVVRSYGQPPGEPERPVRWDLEAVRPRLEELARSGARFALSGWTVGEATWRDRSGALRGRTTSFPLPQLLRDDRVTLRPGAVFQALGRQVYDCAVVEPLEIGDWSVARGESIRVVGPSVADVEKLLATAGGVGATGTVLRRLPAVGESLALGVGALAAALEPGAAAPELRASLEPMTPARGRRRVRVVLENHGDVPTDFGALETNYVELRLSRGKLGRVDAGEFQAVERLWQGSERRTLRALREADTLRLSIRYVGARERFESGPIELRASSGAERVTMSGRFLVPGGRELELAPAAFTIE